jgi:exodeoxyribonuclease-3
MKLISWNVNGLRAVIGKNFAAELAAMDADILCLQETKARPDQVVFDWPEDMRVIWNPAQKPGYSGTLLATRLPVLSEQIGIGMPQHDREGRVITVEHPDFFVVTVYTPNSQNELRRLDYRTREWDRDFLAYCKELEDSKPVIFCGDLNVAHKEIDLANPASNRRNAGFTDEERAGFDAILEAGFLDTFREMHPDLPEQYSWWSYRAGARARNIGWRIDYVCISAVLRGKLRKAFILPEVMGSDHCPVGVELDA